MSGPAQSNEPGPPGRFRRGLRAFRDWRRSRPFWGGLLVLLGGVEILASERAPLPLVIHIGLQGLAGYLVPIVLVLCGVLLLFHPVQQLFYALLAIVLALGSWITSNLGGFFVGMLLALTGGALAFAWQRDRRQPAVQGSGQGPGPGGQGPATDQRDPAGTPAEPDQPARPRHARSAGLALVRGSRKTGSDRADGGADGGGGGRESGGSALLAAPLAPLAMTMLAAISSRGLPAVSLPLVPLVPIGQRLPAVASPSASPVPSPPVPSPRPSPDPPAGSGSGGSGSRPPRPLHHPRPPRPGARVPDAAAAADSSRLTARFAALTGLTYDGVAIVPTARGREPMLKFTMRSLRLPGAALSVGLGGGAAGAAGTASLVTADTTMELSGNVELYTTRLTGVLNGVTVTFTATRPPGALPPNLTLTGVTAEQPYAAADLMRADGSHVSTG